MLRGKKIMIFCCFLVIVSMLTGGVAGYYDARLEAAVVPKKKSLDKVKVSKKLTFQEDVINILLVGSDHGAMAGDSGRSDSMMVATIDLKRKELKLTSFLRDMYVNVPGHGRDKLNSAYAYGGETLLYQTIAENFGIKIDKFCIVDFSAFEKVIDRIGGIEMTLEEQEANYLNTTNYISKKKYRNVKTGTQTLNGNQALGYARVRHVDSKKYGIGEFGRTGRQRAVLQATFHQMLKQNPVEIIDIAIDALGDVSTDMTASYIKELIYAVAKMDVSKIKQLRIPIENTYKMSGATAPPCGFVFFVNFKANQEALKYFMFHQGKKQNFAKNYGGTQNIDTFGYSAKEDYNQTIGDSGNIFE
ncbi:MAG: LCP family protein [Anaerostipes sp.]|nr:LCP family protein [Anaerostipes sp.]